MKLIPSGLLTVIGLSMIGATAAFADVIASKSSGAISFQDKTGMYNGTLNVSGPDGFQSKSFSETGLPGFTVQGSGALADGLYSYTLSAATRNKENVDTSLDNGRGSDAPNQAAVPYSTSGTFRISNGQIVVNEVSATSLFGQDPGE
jgi:hypothetical protein